MVLRSRGMSAQSLKIVAGSSVLCQVKSHRHLGVIFSETLTWSDHVDHVLSKASSKLGFLRHLRRRLSCLIIRDLYLGCILPSLEYASAVWCDLSASDAARLERFNRAAGRLIGNISVSSQTPHAIVLARSGLQTLTSRRQVRQISLANCVLHGCLPRHVLLATTGWRTLADHLGDSSLVLRSSDSVRLPRPRKNCLKASLPYTCLSRCLIAFHMICDRTLPMQRFAPSFIPSFFSISFFCLPVLAFNLFLSAFSFLLPFCVPLFFRPSCFLHLTLHYSHIVGYWVQ